ncbi:MAG: SGNH hydrolase domain-containing protein, partial [Pseudomonadota bacterium]
ADWTEARLAWIEANPQIRHVVLAYRHSAYLFGENGGTYPALPDQMPTRVADGATKPAKRSFFLHGFGQMIARLRAAGRDVIVLAPVPELGRHVEKLILRSESRDPIAGVPRPYYDARNRLIRGWLDGQGPAIRVLDPVKSLCDARTCLAGAGGAAFYFDSHHLSLAGARRVLAGQGGRTLLAGRGQADSRRRAD